MNKGNVKKYNSTLYFEEAVEKKGWWKSHQFLMIRRFCQIMIIVLFALPIGEVNNLLVESQNAASPELTLTTLENLKHEDGVRQDDIWILKGTLANSEILSTVPLGDPFIFVQSMVAGNLYTLSGILGIALITLFYFILGGRTYCSFVCPINIVTDLSAWIRRQLKITNQLSISKNARYYVLGIVIILSAIFQVIVWELVNPITGIFRVLVFGGFTLTNIAVSLTLVIFILDIIGAANLWCGHLCPVGAFYNLLGKKTLLYVNAPKISACDDCMDCYKVCPESHVLKPLIQNKKIYIENTKVPSVNYSDCTRCGRCIDVCPESVFSYGAFKKDLMNKKDKPKVKESEL